MFVVDAEAEFSHQDLPSYCLVIQQGRQPVTHLHEGAGKDTRSALPVSLLPLLGPRSDKHP